MQRLAGSYPLPPRLKERMAAAGFETAGDLLGLKPSELSRELGVSKEEALEILQTVLRRDTAQPSSPSSPQPPPPPCASAGHVSPGTSAGAGPTAWHPDTVRGTGCQSMSALDLLSVEGERGDIVSFCASIDSLLGGGIPTGALTEICGAPGVGKTQICLQLAVSVSVPAELGGLAGTAIFVDTEGSFMVQRVTQMAGAAVRHCQLAARSLGEDAHQAVSSFTTEGILSSIHCYRCLDHTELTALTHLLPHIIAGQPQVRLVVVDSIAFPFRHGFEDLSLRTRLLNGLAQQLIAIATTHHIAVVLTNQMTTRMSSGERDSFLVPALGESWGHAATHRLVLSWEGRNRVATVYKSSSHREDSACFAITADGVRDVAPPNINQSDVHHSPESNPRKRRREDDSTQELHQQ